MRMKKLTSVEHQDAANRRHELAKKLAGGKPMGAEHVFEGAALIRAEKAAHPYAISPNKTYLTERIVGPSPVRTPYTPAIHNVEKLLRTDVRPSRPTTDVDRANIQKAASLAGTDKTVGEVLYDVSNLKAAHRTMINPKGGTRAAERGASNHSAGEQPRDEQGRFAAK